MLPRLVDLRDTQAFHDAALALNRADEAATSPLDAAGLAARLHAAVAAPAAVEGDTLLGFVLANGSDSALDSPNFRWVAARLDRFVYVDRVITAPAARGRGIARMLYASTEDVGRAMGAPWIACEIYADPPNPVSDAFHARLGFETMGHARLPNGKTVRYVRRSIA
jgi:predicted GNAT superfamily acetyltransferase